MMSMMLWTAVVVVIAVTQGTGAWGDKWPRTVVKVKYSPNPFSGYYDMPLSTSDAKIGEWVEVSSQEANTNLPIKIRCRQNDPRVCMIFDLKGTNIGTQISFLDDDVKNVQGYSYTNNPSYIRTKIFGISASSIRVYYTNPEKLTKEGRKATGEVVDGVFAYLDGKLEQLPLLDPKQASSGNFYRQNCFPQMGQHYFFKMNKSYNDCSKQLPFFGIYHNGHLAGFGFATFGKPTIPNSVRNWYESVPLLAVKAIMPDRGQCVDDMVTKNGLYSVHVYFVNTPYLIGCLFQ